MAKRIRFGILTPSSNTVLEPLTQSIINTVNDQQSAYHITVHFSRFPVTTIGLSPDGLAQFELAPILHAASLLAHAEVDIIGWSGTSAGWLGFDRDVTLCAEIEKAIGIKATTSVLALNKALELWGIKGLGLVTPYLEDVQQAIIRNYKGIGIEIGEGMERHLRVEKNTDIANVGEGVLDGVIEDVIKSRPSVITTFCTNLAAAQRVTVWEEAYSIPVFDTVTTVVWDMLRMTGVDARGIQGRWGVIFKR